MELAIGPGTGGALPHRCRPSSSSASLRSRRAWTRTPRSATSISDRGSSGPTDRLSAATSRGRHRHPDLERPRRAGRGRSMSARQLERRPAASARLARCGLAGALAGLVVGQGLGGVHVAERRVGRAGRRRGPAGSRPVASREIDRIAATFISPKPGSASNRRRRSAPSVASVQIRSGVVLVVGRDRRAQRLDLAGHRAREAVQCRRRPEDPVELGGIGRARSARHRDGPAGDGARAGR